MYMQLCSNSQRSKIMIDGDDELMMMPQHQNHVNPPPSSAAVGSARSPQNHRLPSPSLVSLEAPCRVRLADILPYDGAPMPPYLRAVDALSASLMRHNAAVIELGSDDAALLRCALESTRLYFRTKKGGRWAYTYRAGRPLEDVDSSPPCMADIFRCMGKVARAALCAIARNLRLRSDVFNHLLDDTPLPASDPSSSVLVATFSQISSQQGKSATVGGKLASSCEVEKGLLMLISCDAPGLQVCDPNGRWYQADGSLSPGDLLLLTGKALSHATAGLRPAASYRVITDNLVISPSGGRTSLAFRLMPQSNAVLDCTPVAAAGHVIPQSYMPISVSQFMDDLSVEEEVLCNHTDYVPAENMNREPSLRSVLSDPLSGAFLEDAMQVSCGHSFGGLMLRRVLETSKCTLCNAEIDSGSLIPNHALRAAALAAKQEDDRRLFHNAALRKRRKEANEHRENGDITLENGSHRGVQYPFSVLEKVTIKGNKRTPDKFVGKEAVITSQCLNGWYLLRIIETGENVRLQYRSLRKNQSSNDSEDSCAFLEDAMQVSCGHSFGGHMLRRVLETSKCSVCNADIDSGSMIPNHALRAAALAAKQEDDRRLFRNAALRKRRKEANEHRENGDITLENGSHRGVQYPFSVNEKVTIKGNRRTPDKFVGKEAVITSQCLNGWYLLRIIETGENVRLQYRSLRKNLSSNDSEDRCVSEPGQSSS